MRKFGLYWHLLMLGLFFTRIIAAQDAVDDVLSSLGTDARSSTSLIDEGIQQTAVANNLSGGKQFVSIDCACGGDSEQIVGIDSTQKLYKKSSTDWQDITYNFQGKPSKVVIAGDGTIWALNDQKGAFRLDGSSWSAVSGVMRQISVGNKTEVWGISDDLHVVRKVDPAQQSKVASAEWYKIPGPEFIDVCCGGDGTVWAIGKTDGRIYVFNRAQETWTVLIDSSNVGIGTAFRTKIADRFNAIILTSKGEAWRLIPGKKGSAKSDWFLMPGAKFLDVSIGFDGTVVGVTFDGKVAVYDALDNNGEVARQIDAARGKEIVTNQVVRMHSLWDGRRLWTHAFSPYDPKSTNPIPENHIEVLAGVSDPGLDTREDIGCLFMLSDADNSNASKGINYGDPIEIWSLYACAGDDRKAGGRGKEWKWWLNTTHHRWGNAWCEMLVSIMQYPKTRDGSQKFSILSPYGRTGKVRSNDCVMLVSLAPHAFQQPLFIHQWSSIEGGAYEIIAPSKDTTGSWADKTEPYGAFFRSGRQYFRLQAVNNQSDVPDFAQDAYRKALGLEVAVQGLEGGPEKGDMIVDTSAGLGILMEIDNRTDYPLETTIGAINAKETKDQIKFAMSKRFMFSGFCDGGKVDQFGNDVMLEVKPLYSRGTAWIEPSFTPNSLTFTFLAKAGDKGNIQIVFGNKADTDDRFRVHIGMTDNSKSAVLVDGKVFAEADGNTNSLAKATAGIFVPYWVTLKDNFLMVGGNGVAGDNIFLSCYLPLDASDIDRIGFSTHDGPVSFAQVQFADAIMPLTATYEYQSDQQKSLSLPAQPQSLVPLTQSLRVPNEGAISFSARANHTVSCVLFSADRKNSYKIIIGAEENKSAYIIKNGKKALRLDVADIPYGKVFSDRDSRYWVSINGGVIAVGAGNPGTSPLFVWQDKDFLQNITQVGFQCADHEQSISNIRMHPPIEFGTAKEKISYAKSIQRYPYDGGLKLIQAFDFLAFQSGRRVSLKDMLEGSTTPMLNTAQEGSKVPFRIVLYPDGTPQFVQTEEAEKAQELKKLEEKVKIQNATADATLQLAGGLAFSPTGIPLAAALGATGIALKTSAAKDESTIAQKYRSPYSMVDVQQYLKDAGVKVQIPPKIQDDIAIIQTLQAQSRDLVVAVVDDFVKMVKTYATILQHITHPYAVEDPAVKKTIFETFDTLIGAYKPYPAAIQKMLLDLLVDAYQNTSLSTDSEKTERARRARWYYAMVDIGKQLLIDSVSTPVQIKPMYGEYFWLPIPFEYDDRGWVSFEVLAQNDVFISFASDMQKVRDTDNKIYELVLGSYENSQHEIRIKSLGRPAVVFSKDTATDARGNKLNELDFKRSLLAPTVFEQYWVSVKDGELRIGKGQPGKNVLVKWIDPFPWQGIRYVGFSSWDTPLTLRNIKVGSFGPKPGSQVKQNTYTPAQPVTQADAVANLQPAELASSLPFEINDAPRVITAASAPGTSSTRSYAPSSSSSASSSSGSRPLNPRQRAMQQAAGLGDSGE